MKREMVVAILMITILLSSGCFTKLSISPVTRVHLGEEHVFQKNYTINQRSIAYVGQQVVKVKDYWVNRYRTQIMRASNDFVITGGVITGPVVIITGQANKDYSIVGETFLDDKPYTVLKVPVGSCYMGLLINADGSVHNKVSNLTTQFGNIVMVPSFKSTPSNLKFVRLEEKVTSKDKGSLNYELLYGGTDGKMITITYREFTSENLARSSFYQNLVYDSKQKTIRFRNTVIMVHSATNEKMDYTVISDDLKK